MFKTNEYFDGKVMSIAITTADGPATIGAMAAGEYEFGTSTKEYMTVTSGVLIIKLPGSDNWETFEKDVRSRTPLGRMATPNDVAYAAVYLASDEASMVTGMCISVDGGSTT